MNEFYYQNSYDQDIAVNCQCRSNCDCNRKATMEPELFTPLEALTLGNAFRNEYLPFNGFSNFPISIRNRRDQLLVEMNKYAFMAHEANLFLDVNPRDKKMFEVFKENTKLANIAKEKYEKEFGPVFVSDQTNSWQWNDEPWPWERG